VTTTITPFTIKIAREQVDDLKERLARTRTPDEAPGDGWSRGVPTDYRRRMLPPALPNGNCRKHFELDFKEI
jgi:hypothetical protein